MTKQEHAKKERRRKGMKRLFVQNHQLRCTGPRGMAVAMRSVVYNVATMCAQPMNVINLFPQGKIFYNTIKELPLSTPQHVLQRELWKAGGK